MADGRMAQAECPAEWFAALHREDCVQVLELLRVHPYLLAFGLSENPIQVVKRLRSGRQFWKGRTALHVGARRGSVELVKEVLGLYDDNARSDYSDSLLVPGIVLGDLLAAKDGWYKLDALAMAVLNGNRDIMRMLAIASLEKCETNPYEISSSSEVQLASGRGQSPSLTVFEWESSIPNLSRGEVQSEASSSAESELLENSRMQLREVTKEVMDKLRLRDGESLKALYRSSCDFNFLPWEEYLFHFTFLKWPRQKFLYMDEVSQNIFDKCRSSPDLRSFLFKLRDGQGRTALHVAVDEQTVMRFLLLLSQPSTNFSSVADSRRTMSELDSLAPNEDPDEDYRKFLNAADGTGRVALHRAAAIGNSESLRLLMDDNRVSLNALYSPWEYAESLWATLGIDMERVSKNNGFKGYGWFDIYDFSNALHIAIINKRIDCVNLLLDEKYNACRAEDDKLDLNFPFTRAYELRNGGRRRCALEPLQLSAVIGDARILKILLEDKRIRDPGRPSNWRSSSRCTTVNPWPALHIVAASGKFELLKLVMQNRNYDMLVQDLEQNTALHHATKGREFHFFIELIDHFHCEHARESIRETTTDDEGSHARNRRDDVERQGCIELLLQAGFDIWKTNQANEAPYPGPEASVEILAWWYKKLGKETIAQQSTLNGAAFAISVTATLVATASYQGPLQPPLGWSSTTSRLQVSSTPMRIFIVCDTFSFYLAIASIMSALIPSLPLAQESTLDELRRTRQMVVLAAGFLFPSILCILIAFAAATIAVIPNEPSWNDGGLTIVTSSIGVVMCVGVLCVFVYKLLGRVFSRNPGTGIRNLFKATVF